MLNLDQQLTEAANIGDQEGIKKYVAEGANVNALAIGDYSPLYFALRHMPGIQKDILGTVKLLVENGADVNLKMKDNETALITAAEGGQLEAVEYLIEQGADVNATLDSGANALHLIAEKIEGRPMNYTVTVTVDGKPKTLTDPDEIRKATGSHPDDEHRDLLKIVKLLLKAGIDTEAKNLNGQTPIYTATAVEDDDLIDMIIKAGADLNTHDKWGITVLSYVCRQGNLALVKKFVQAGADVNAADDIGFTPLHEAAENQHVDVLKYLLEQGADPNQGLKKAYKEYPVGTTPFDLAQKTNNKTIMELLSQGQKFELRESIESKDWTWSEHGQESGVKIENDLLIWYTQDEKNRSGGGGMAQQLSDFAQNGPIATAPKEVLEEIKYYLKK